MPSADTRLVQDSSTHCTESCYTYRTCTWLALSAVMFYLLHEGMAAVAWCLTHLAVPPACLTGSGRVVCAAARRLALSYDVCIHCADGEISPPSEKLLTRIRKAHVDMGLDVHGLIVSPDVRMLTAVLMLFARWQQHILLAPVLADWRSMHSAPMCPC